jgi:uncharacterized protein (TIGR02217 family)
VFIEKQFPSDLSYGSSIGPEFKTTVTESKSGAENRNANWSTPLRKADVSFKVRTQDQLDTLLAWFRIAKGKANAFRFKDWSDYKSSSSDNNTSFLDQPIGTGTGALLTFQLKKTYDIGGFQAVENIVKPVVGSVMIGVNGVQKTETTHYTVNYITGIVTFITAPPNTQAVTAGYEYDIPARFDTDELSANLYDYKIASAHAPIVQTRDFN